MDTKKYVSLVTTLAMVGAFALTTAAFADSHAVVGGDNEVTITTMPGVTGSASVKAEGDVNQKNGDGQVTTDGQVKMDSERMMPAVVGKVSAINGTTLTVISQKGFNEATTNTTFTVDTAHAALLRGNTAITLSDIAIGDTVIVQGTVTGTAIAATTIRDGKVGNGNKSDNNQALLQIQGNGQPVIGGTISAINGSTLTVTNSSNVTYTVNAATAKIVQGKNTILLSAVKVGDSVIVQGTVNGTAVTASTIVDTNVAAGKSIHMGFFGSIGQFFRHLFGF